MAYIDLWGAYVHACNRFGIYPAQSITATPSSGPGTNLPGRSPMPPDPSRTPSLTADFLRNQTNTEGLGWFAELGAQIVRDIATRNELDLNQTTRPPEPPADFAQYFAQIRRLRPP